MRAPGRHACRPTLRLPVGGLMRAIFALYLLLIVAGLSTGIVIGLLQH
jgi:hypothetical protein